MKQWFYGLNAREQMSVMALALALLLYVVFVGVLEPLSDKRASLEQQNTVIAESLSDVDAMVSEIKQLRESGAQTNGKRNLTTLINRSTSRLQLPVSRLQPNSRGEIQVRLEDAAFDDMLKWLHEMEYREGLLVREVSMTQGRSSGRVNVTVRMAQAG